MILTGDLTHYVAEADDAHEQLAIATGGRVDPTRAQVVAARDGRAHEMRPFGTWLVAVAMALVLADVALRRFDLPGWTRRTTT